MVPSARWFIRQRTNRVIEELNTRLPIEKLGALAMKREASNVSRSTSR
jgi:hypothetical protein